MSHPTSSFTDARVPVIVYGDFDLSILSWDGFDRSHQLSAKIITKALPALRISRIAPLCVLGSQLDVVTQYSREFMNYNYYKK